MEAADNTTMIWFKKIFIMASLVLTINMIGQANAADLNQLKNVVDQISAVKDTPQSYTYKLEREESYNPESGCAHCPKHVLLAEQANKIVEKMVKDPNLNIDKAQLVKINKLKFLFYSEAVKNSNGSIECHRYMDFTNDFKPTKFDGQFKLMAEDVLKFNDVTDIQYMNPDLDEIVYYYRGEGDEKNLIVQAILTKDGGKLRYFRYTPSEKEMNPYNLPDIYVAEKEQVTNSEENVAHLTSDPGQTTVHKSQSGINVNFKAELETKHKYIPSNVHFVDVKLDQDVYGGLKVQGTSDTSLKGNSAKMSLKNEAGEDVVVIELDTKLSGKTDHKITIPYSVRVAEESDVMLKGNVHHESTVGVMTMSIADKAMEYIRSEYRMNSANGKNSYVLARDVRLDTNQTVSVQYGKGEDDIKYASLKHVKNLKNNATLVLDVRLSENRKSSIYYEYKAPF